MDVDEPFRSELDPHTSLPRWFDAAREASIAYMARFHGSPPPASLFHYTSTSALISIVRNNELWLSDATFLNDKVEIEYGRSLACSRLEATIVFALARLVALVDAPKGISILASPPSVRDGFLRKSVPDGEATA